MRIRLVRIFLLLVAVAVITSSGSAQARVKPDGDNASVVVLNNLSFGTVVIGRDLQKRVTFSDAGAARALVMGLSQNETVSLNFYLPHYLYAEGHRLRIIFNANSAAWSIDNGLSGATSFNPHLQLRLPPSALVTGNLYLWIGATLNINSQQEAGQYHGYIRVQINVDHTED